MTFRGGAIEVSVRGLWIGAWAAWLGCGALLPLPPWSASRLLALEERKAEAAAEAAGRAASWPAWSVDVGGRRQSQALGEGWSVHEAFSDAAGRRRFVWIDGERAQIRFVSPEWRAAQLAVEAAPLEGLAPLAVDAVVDGQTRGTLRFPTGWAVARLAIGPLAAGRHVLELRPRRRASPPGEARHLSLAVDGIGIGEDTDIAPSRDRGVFAGWRDVAGEDRPALYAPRADLLPLILDAGVVVRLEPELYASYGFGYGGAANAATRVLVVIHGLLAAALVLLVPGLGWSARFGRATGALRLVELLGLSTLGWLVSFLVLRLAAVHPDGWPAALAAAGVGAAPLPLLEKGARLAVSWRDLGVVLVSLVLLSVFATAVVPPLEDQDMEVQATAYSLATRQVPLALTNRGTAYFFAHPPLLHLWQAGSFALSGRLERVRYYAEAGARALERPFAEPDPGQPLAGRPHYDAWKGLLRRFLVEPQLWPTRQVNVLCAALAVALTAHLTAAISGSTGFGLLLAGVLLSFPEFLVRGAYGGYFASTTLLTLLLLAGLEERGRPGALGLGGALAFLANQKGLLAPVAWAAAAPAQTGRHRFVPVGGAFLALLAYLAYGLALEPAAFGYDFLKEHVVRRLLPVDVRFVSDATRFYPSIPELWKELGERYGWGFVLLAALASVRGVGSPRPAVRAASAAVLIGAAAFSITDWRQTKHLALLAAPALVAISDLALRVPGRRRVAAAVALLLCLRNLWHAWPLLASFEAVRPSTSW